MTSSAQSNLKWLEHSEAGENIRKRFLKVGIESSVPLEINRLYCSSIIDFKMVCLVFETIISLSNKPGHC